MLPLCFDAARLQSGAAFFQILPTPFQRDAARVGGRDGFGLPLQDRLCLGQAGARVAQPNRGALPTRAILCLRPGERVPLFG